MPTFDVIWNRTRLQWARRAERAPWVVEAILLGLRGRYDAGVSGCFREGCAPA
jgi:hypothetical protein